VSSVSQYFTHLPGTEKVRAELPRLRLRRVK
jgi:hypothetical protein